MWFIRRKGGKFLNLFLFLLCALFSVKYLIGDLFDLKN